MKSIDSLNYDLMRNVLVDAISQLEIVTDIREVTAMQKQVEIKEAISKY